MAITAARLLSNGTYRSAGTFDEVTYAVGANKVTISTIFTAGLDEVALQGGSVAKRETSDGLLLVSGQFDEVTGITFIGSTISTVTPSIFNNVTIGTANGSPFSNLVNSYQFATQPVSSPYNYITLPGSSGLAIGTGDFTIEWFQYQTVAASYARIFWYTSTVGATNPSMGLSEETAASFWTSSGRTVIGNYGSILNTWVHFAVVRINGVLYFYKNGALISSAANTGNISDSSSTFYIGTKSNGGAQSEQFSGSITSFRIINGLGVYTGNFTPPKSVLGQTQGANPYGGSNTLNISDGQCVLLLNP